MDNEEKTEGTGVVVDSFGLLAQMRQNPRPMTGWSKNQTSINIFQVKLKLYFGPKLNDDK